ncbi:MAG: hypothetical protein WBK91_05790 [Alphaproteobacteria bacterium]
MDHSFKFPNIDKSTLWQILSATKGDQEKIAAAKAEIWSLEENTKPNHHPTLRNVIATTFPHLEQLVQPDDTIKTSLDHPQDTKPYLNRYILIASQKLLTAYHYPEQAVRAANIIALVADIGLALQAWGTLLDYTERADMPDALRAKIPGYARDTLPGEKEIGIRFSQQLCCEYMVDQILGHGQLDMPRLRTILGDPNEQHQLWNQARQADQASERSSRINDIRYESLRATAEELRQRIMRMNDPPPPNRPYRDQGPPDSPPVSGPS